MSILKWCATDEEFDLVSKWLHCFDLVQKAVLNKVNKRESRRNRSSLYKRKKEMPLFLLTSCKFCYIFFVRSPHSGAEKSDILFLRQNESKLLHRSDFFVFIEGKQAKLHQLLSVGKHTFMVLTQYNPSVWRHCVLFHSLELKKKKKSQWNETDARTL